MALSNSNVLGIVNNSPRTRAVRHLQEWVMDGRLTAGARLPTEMQLAAKLNVSRTTIRLALADLEREGTICSQNRRWIVSGNVKPKRTFLSDSVVMIVEPPERLDYSNTIHSTWHIDFIQTGAMEAIRMAGYDAFTLHPKRIAGDLLQRLIAERPRGAIILWQVLQEESGKYIGQALQEGNIPFVVYGDMSPSVSEVPELANVDSVLSDHEAGAYALTRWLIEQGRKRILRFWQMSLHGPHERQIWLLRRDVGYERAMRDAGIEPLPAREIYAPGYHNFGNTKDDFDFRARMMAGYLVEHLTGPDRIDAIMAPSDALIGHLTAALKIHGLEPNRDVLLVGYDNMWDDLEVRQWEPLGPVATVDKRNLEIGSQLMALLQERIDGKLFAEGERRVVTPQLVIRPSAFPDASRPLPIYQPVLTEPRDS